MQAYEQGKIGFETSKDNKSKTVNLTCKVGSAQISVSFLCNVKDRASSPGSVPLVISSVFEFTEPENEAKEAI